MPVTALRTKNAVESLRDVVQDLLVPELKAIKADLESTRREMRSEFEAIRTEVKLRDEKQAQATQALSTEIRTEFESLRTEMKLRDEKQTQATQALSEKVSSMMEVRERLAVLEDRAKRD